VRGAELPPPGVLVAAEPGESGALDADEGLVAAGPGLFDQLEGSTEGGLHTLAIELTEKFDAGSDIQRLRLSLQLRFQCATADDDQPRLLPRAAQFTNRLEEYRDSLVGLIQRSDRD